MSITIYDDDSDESDIDFLQDDPILHPRETGVSSGHDFTSLVQDFGTYSDNERFDARQRRRQHGNIKSPEVPAAQTGEVSYSIEMPVAATNISAPPQPVIIF